MAELMLCAAVVVLLAVFGRDFTGGGLKAMLIVALMAGLASAGRAVLSAIPSVQPASFIVVMAGLLFGPGSGLVCGIITGLLSDLLIGMVWPYAAWHMLLWGVMGLAAGLLRTRPIWLHAAMGFAWGFVFGWCMNIWYYTTGAAPFVPAAFIAACVLSAPFDLAHALTNFVLIAAFAAPIRKLFFKLEVHIHDTGKGS